jgi:hypothetical protein
MALFVVHGESQISDVRCQMFKRKMAFAGN